MATPIAHKGATAGAKAQALTMLDILLEAGARRLRVELLPERPDEDGEVRAAHAPRRRPATELNTDILARYRPEMRKFYYDPKKFPNYLEQLGIAYPTLRKSKEKCEETPTVP